MKFRVTCEHTSGASVSHPCTRGLYDDPANVFKMVIEAENEDAAVDEARKELASIVRGTPACDCRRRWQPGSDRWWESVAIIAVPD